MDGVARAIAFEEPIKCVAHVATTAMHWKVSGFVDDNHPLVFIEPTNVFVDRRINAHGGVLPGQGLARRLHREGQAPRLRGRVIRR